MSSLVNRSQLLIKSPKAKLHLILNARCSMSYENPVVRVSVQIVQIRAPYPNYYTLLRASSIAAVHASLEGRVHSLPDVGRTHYSIFFRNQTKLPIMSILASEALLCKNKKYSVTKCYHSEY